MATEPRPTFDVELAAGEAKFLAIYRPMRPIVEGMREKYGLAFPAEAVPASVLLWGVRVRPPKEGVFDRPTVSCSNTVRPEVVPYDDQGTNPTLLVDLLVRELARLDARNVPRERVFEGRRLVATLRPFDYEVMHHRGTALALVKLAVCMTPQ